MGNHHDSIALDWVRGEIQETLTQGRQALEAFADNRADTARLRFCLNYLRQVHGTLQMVELFGAALLTEEMEKLTQAILNETIANVDEAVEVLMDAMLQLPQYLEHLNSNKDDFALILLPLLNDLRAARGETLLSDTSLFKPDLTHLQDKASSRTSARLSDPRVQGHLRKLRQMYQFALVGIVREENLNAHFDYLHKVIERLIKLCQGTPRAEFWKAAGGFVETLQSGDSPVNTAVKSILRNLDIIELRPLVDEHADILQQPVPEALFKHLLYYVAKARHLDTPYIRDLRERYRLDEALPSETDVRAARTRISGPGREAIHSVVLALNEELNKLKDQLDLFVRAQFRNNEELGDLLPGLGQLANTLAVLGLSIPRQVITEQIDIIDHLSKQTDAVDDNTLMDIAGALLYVEASLTSLDNDQQLPSDEEPDSPENYDSQELSEANTAVLRESRNTLEQIKTAIISFIASQWDSREIEHVPGLLHSIRGGLNLLPLPRITAVLDSCERYVSDALLTGKHVPDWQQLDTLADAITSIEYYLERLVDGITDNESILRIAEQSLEALGFPAGAAPAWSPAESAETDESSDENPVDPALLDIFENEARAHLHTLRVYLDNAGNKSSVNYNDNVSRALHTLKGSAHAAAIVPITKIITPLEHYVKDARTLGLRADRDVLELIDEACRFVTEGLEQLRRCPQGDLTGTEAFLEKVNAVSVRTFGSHTGTDAQSVDGKGDPHLVQLFLREGLDILLDADTLLDQWAAEPLQTSPADTLTYELQQLAKAARQARLDDVAELSAVLAASYQRHLQFNTGPSAAFLSVVSDAHESLINMMDQAAAGLATVLDASLINELEDIGHSQSIDPGLADISGEDLDLAEIFLDEAAEIINTTADQLHNWRANPNQPELVAELQRELHTLKGGARMTGVAAVANIAHELETLFERIADGRIAATEARTSLAIKAHDQLAALIEVIAKTGQCPAVPHLVGELQSAASVSAIAETPALTALDKVASKRAEPSCSMPADRAAQERIRVSAPLLDELVNLAGETSITRGHLEQQTSGFSHALDEMASTIERLREQLRRMDIETEAQILFRAEREHGPDYGNDFDPLEMDRYSSIQQLSRALSESSSDLADLRSTMAERLKDTETLLVQQSRINTELQEGLMKTRMIPFSSMVPRLRRIVRQVSSELGKKANFDVHNAEGEMDRNILERMIPPMEHMLRNALDHGIETPQARVQAGKPESGNITLSLTREGGDLVLRIKDDGAGIPVEVIRDQAIRLGLMRTDADLGDRDILQFILQPGLTTNQNVTQISGRGVGMNVVATEIKQLGGSLDIDSRPGSGTTFIVRLPFTVSVNRALMVSTGEDFYAIPLNTIEGIVRVSTSELEGYYQPDAPMYEYAGQQYRLQYLGALLNSDHHPKLQGQALPLPVILVRGTEQPMALQVDNILGSREIVVKSLGPQFSAVRGVSGATILGDGNVVVILDLPAMIRSDILSERPRQTELDTGQNPWHHQARPTMVMVVDDSVTVRKVTSRLLERNGMEVVTAKDGMDAVAQLQDHRPDIILLDIEMPRMDGFEVASFVRHDDNLRDIPICMITSRTGQKHRERALAIGVNEYLGKPFQETDLLTTIKRLTGEQ